MEDFSFLSQKSSFASQMDESSFFLLKLYILESLILSKNPSSLSFDNFKSTLALNLWQNKLINVQLIAQKKFNFFNKK